MLDVEIKIVHVKLFVHDINAMRHSFDVVVTLTSIFVFPLISDFHFTFFVHFLRLTFRFVFYFPFSRMYSQLG